MFFHARVRSRRRTPQDALATGFGPSTRALASVMDAFLLPALCPTQAGTAGVKAIFIYPMNALASDQAQRIARIIHRTPSFRGIVTAGCTWESPAVVSCSTSPVWRHNAAGVLRYLLVEESTPSMEAVDLATCNLLRFRHLRIQLRFPLSRWPRAFRRHFLV